jgi:hypothetical protein
VPFALFLCAAVASCQAPAEVLHAGPLRLEIHVSRTATLFHVVDQLSAWSPFCHGQYARGLDPLDAADRAQLARHRDVRTRHPFGAGLERALYTPLALDDALAAAADAGGLTWEDADTEREVLAHFAERVERLSAAESAHVEAFRARIRTELPAATELAERLEAWIGRTPEPVPVYLIANPDDHDFGGGYNGGRLTVEVPRVADAWPTFLHEVFHAFLETRRADLERAVVDLPGLDFQTLNEGLAHALAPGLHHAGPPDSDPLAERVRALERDGRRLDDYDGRVYRYALALRPLAREALAPERAATRTFAADLERALDAWRVLTELEASR